jgi:hypothetical protein
MKMLGNRGMKTLKAHPIISLTSFIITVRKLELKLQNSRPLVKLGEPIRPLVVHKLADPRNFYATQLCKLL